MCKRPLIAAVAAGIMLSGLALWSAPASTSLSQSVPDPRAEVQETLTQYCVSCHNDRLKTAGLVLNPADAVRAGDQAELWEKVLRQLRAGTMPPPGAP